jgi:hypothetical protein
VKGFLSTWVSGPLRTAVIVGACLLLVVGIGQAATAMYVGGRAIGGGLGVTAFDFIPGIWDGWNGAKEESKAVREAYKSKNG